MTRLFHVGGFVIICGFAGGWRGVLTALAFVGLCTAAGHWLLRDK